MPPRAEVLHILAECILSLDPGHPLRVGIDGVDTAGKTRLAHELALLLQGAGREVLRASIDGFHLPRQVRYRAGRDSPEGYYLDSFNYPVLRETLLEPLGPGGSREVRTACFEHRLDVPVYPPWITVGEHTVLIFDGVFLQRPELVDVWDYTIFVQIDVETMLQRALVRDGISMGGRLEARRRYTTRYIPAQMKYIDTCHPDARANVILKNDDIDCPELKFKGLPW
jgi:uridine kinase